MNVSEIWRYPVKSMAGEKIETVRISALGIERDRAIHVEDSQGRWITARTHPRLLGHHARLGSDGEPLVDEIPWTEPRVRDCVVDIVGQGALLVRDNTSRRFDVLPLMVATDGAIAAFGYEGRRLRPNIVIAGVDGLAERSWPGHCLHIANVILGIQDLRGRCVMTTFDPDTLEQDRRVFRKILEKFGGKLALNCNVIRGGIIRVGDPALLVPRVMSDYVGAPRQAHTRDLGR